MYLRPKTQEKTFKLTVLPACENLCILNSCAKLWALGSKLRPGRYLGAGAGGGWGGGGGGGTMERMAVGRRQEVTSVLMSPSADFISSR